MLRSHQVHYSVPGLELIALTIGYHTAVTRYQFYEKSFLFVDHKSFFSSVTA